MSCIDHLPGLLPVIGPEYGKPFPFEIVGDQLDDILFVIGNENLLLRHVDSLKRGKWRETVVPRPRALSMTIRPWCTFIRCLTIESPSPVPPRLPGTGLVRPVEPFAQPGNFAFRNADARIGDPDDQILFRAGRRRDGDRSPFRGEFDCIVQNVQQNLYQLVPVGPDRRQVLTNLLESFSFFSEIRSATTARA